MSSTVKKYLISSLITFVTAFAVAVLPSIDKLTLESLATGALASLLFTGIRAGIKAILEYIIASKA